VMRHMVVGGAGKTMGQSKWPGQVFAGGPRRLTCGDMRSAGGVVRCDQLPPMTRPSRDFAGRLQAAELELRRI